MRLIVLSKTHVRDCRTDASRETPAHPVMRFVFVGQ